jgi:hypothetical protein
VANPRRTRLIYASKRKTDEVDAESLARLARVDPKLLYPLKHRGEDSQAHLALIRSREALVSTRTQLINHTLALDKQCLLIEVRLDVLQRLAETLNHRTLRRHEGFLPNRQLRAIGRRMKGQAHTCSR